MSADTVDDLHVAEDGWATAVALLGRVANFAVERPWTGLADAGGYEEFRTLLSAIHVGAAALDGYCRPTCGAEGDPDSDECGDDTCGCACGHTRQGDT